jgi:hypothetical protein
MASTAVINSISSTIITLKAIEEYYQIIKDDKGLREAFHEASRALHIVEEALQTAKTQLHRRSLAERSQSVMTSLKACNTKAKLFESILKIVSEAPETARFERYKAAVQQEGNGKTVEALAMAMMKDVCDVAENDTMKIGMEQHVKRLRDAINKLLKMEASVPNESSGNSFNAYNDSNQFNAIGGIQNNNTGSGHQFTGANFSGSVNFAKNP